MQQLNHHERRRAQGFTIVELMVGLALALISGVVIYKVLSVTEGLRRDATTIGNSQEAGSLAMYALQQDIMQAGAGLPDPQMYQESYGSSPGTPVVQITDHKQGTTVNGVTVPAPSNFGFEPAAINAGAGANGSDSLTLLYGSSTVGQPMAAYYISATSTASSVDISSDAGVLAGDLVVLAQRYSAANSLQVIYTLSQICGDPAADTTQVPGTFKKLTLYPNLGSTATAAQIATACGQGTQHSGYRYVAGVGGALANELSAADMSRFSQQIPSGVYNQQTVGGTPGTWSGASPIAFLLDLGQGARNPTYQVALDNGLTATSDGSGHLSYSLYSSDGIRGELSGPVADNVVYMTAWFVENNGGTVKLVQSADPSNTNDWPYIVGIWIGLVTQNQLAEKHSVYSSGSYLNLYPTNTANQSTTCSSSGGSNFTSGTDPSATSVCYKLNNSYTNGDPHSNMYHYRTYSEMIPMRNLLWSPCRDPNYIAPSPTPAPNAWIANCAE